MRHIDRLRAISVGVLAMLAGGTSPAVAAEPFRVTDTTAHPGAMCTYDASHPRHRVFVPVPAPRLLWPDRDPAQTEAGMVGWQVRLQVAPDAAGPWRTGYVSSITTGRATDERPASVDKLAINWRVTDPGAAYRVRLDLFWFAADGSVARSVRVPIDHYRLARARAQWSPVSAGGWRIGATLGRRVGSCPARLRTGAPGAAAVNPLMSRPAAPLGMDLFPWLLPSTPKPAEATGAAAVTPPNVTETPASVTMSTPGSAPAYVRAVRTTRKVVAFTFDADMKSYMWDSRHRVRWYDPRIVRLLTSGRLPATVFVNGLFAKAYPGVVRRLAATPTVEIGNHTWDHLGWTDPCFALDPVAPPMTKRAEVVRSADEIEHITGTRPTLFRFAAGCHTTADLRLVHRLGERAIGWDDYLGDSLGWTPAQMVRHVRGSAHRGSIIVMHLNGAPYHPGTYEAVSRLIPAMRVDGWRRATVSELLRRDG